MPSVVATSDTLPTQSAESCGVVASAKAGGVLFKKSQIKKELY